MNGPQIMRLLDAIRLAFPTAEIQDHTMNMGRGYIDIFIGSRVFVLELFADSTLGISEIRSAMEGWSHDHDVVVRLEGIEQIVDRLRLQ